MAIGLNYKQNALLSANFNTGFGLSTSLEIQTNSFLQVRTESIGQGTPVWMAPEIMLEDLHFASQQDLMRADIWSLTLLMFAMINPNLPHPYFAEFERFGIPFSNKAFESLRINQ